MTSQTNSEFGKGLCYCLGLFLAHADRIHSQLETYSNLRKANPDLFKEDSAVEMWFNGAADHFFEFQPDSAPTSALRRRCKELGKLCLKWRLPLYGDKKPTIDDAVWAIQEAKDLLRLIDEANGIPTEKGQWE